MCENGTPTVEEDECQRLLGEAESAIRSRDPHNAIDLLEKASLIVINTDNNLLMATIHSYFGNAYSMLGDHTQAVHYNLLNLQYSRCFFQSDKIMQAEAYSNLSISYMMLKKYKDAIACADKMLKMADELEDKLLECQAYSNLGLANLNYVISNQQLGAEKVKYILTEAAEYFERQLQIESEIGNQEQKAIGLGNIANAHFYMGNYERAIEYYEQRLELANELQDRRAIRRSLANIARASKLMKDYYRAHECYKDALVIAQKDACCPPELVTQLHIELKNLEKIISTDESISLNEDITIEESQQRFNRSCMSLVNLTSITDKRMRNRRVCSEAKTTQRNDTGSEDEDEFFNRIWRAQGKKMADQCVDFNATKVRAGDGQSGSGTSSRRRFSLSRDSLPRAMRSFSNIPGGSKTVQTIKSLKKSTFGRMSFGRHNHPPSDPI